MAMSPLLVKDSLIYYLTGDLVTISRPTGWEISLHSGAPGPDGTENEVTDANYTRQPVTFAVDDSNPLRPFAHNDDDVIFPDADNSYTVTHIVVWDAGGNILTNQPLRTPKLIAAEEPATLATGELVIGG